MIVEDYEEEEDYAGTKNDRRRIKEDYAGTKNDRTEYKLVS